MNESWRLFGETLRRFRSEAGLSLAELAARVHYSKGYLSHLEAGRKPAGIGVARRCDAALGADGELAALAVRSGPSDTPPIAEDRTDGEAWVMSLGSDGASWFTPVSRRDALATGTTALLALSMTERPALAAARQTAAVDVFRMMFEQHRRLGQTMSPAAVLPAVIAQTHTLRELAASARPPAQRPLLLLAARYAEYAGWMAQESGHDQAAMWWTRTAVDLAGAAGETNLVAHGFVRQALISLYRDDARQTVDLACRAQAEASAPAGIRGQAALREAQGHAVAGDDSGCRRALDRAATLLDTAADGGVDGLSLGQSTVHDIGAVVTGWCLYDLGRPREAAEMLDREVAKIPPTARRAHARFGARQALAHAAAGEIDHACALAGPVLDSAELVDSATIRCDLRRLSRTTNRWHNHSAVVELRSRITAALYAPVP